MISLDFMLESSHVSVPIIMSGSVDSIIASSSLSFFFKLLKFMFNILRCFFVAGFVFGFGDDVMISEPALKDVESKECDSMLDPDVDGMDASDIYCLPLKDWLICLALKVCCRLRLV